MSKMVENRKKRKSPQPLDQITRSLYGNKANQRAFQTHYMRGTMSKNGQDRSGFANTSLIVILKVSHPNMAYGHVLTGFSCQSHD
jgi:hypothetical protein